MFNQENEQVDNNSLDINEVESQADIESVRQALAEQKEKADEYLSSWQRSVADFSNYKKRAEQEKGEFTSFANSALIFTLLPVLDDMERAFNSLPQGQDDLKWVEGFRLIQKKMQTILEAQGLTEIEALGKPFDPSVHEAVAHIDGKEGMVIDVMQKGYKLKDKVLRPSLVSVGNGTHVHKK